MKTLKEQFIKATGVEEDKLDIERCDNCMDVITYLYPSEKYIPFKIGLFLYDNVPFSETNLMVVLKESVKFDLDFYKRLNEMNKDYSGVCFFSAPRTLIIRGYIVHNNDINNIFEQVQSLTELVDEEFSDIAELKPEEK